MAGDSALPLDLLASSLGLTFLSTHILWSRSCTASSHGFTNASHPTKKAMRAHALLFRELALKTILRASTTSFIIDPNALLG